MLHGEVRKDVAWGCEEGCCMGMWRRMLHEDVEKGVAWRGEEGCCVGM